MGSGRCWGHWSVPVVRESVSISVFCDELGIDPKRFIGVEVNRQKGTVVLVLEPDDGTDQRRDTSVEQLRETHR